jgi:hypothetical protein
LTDLLQATQDGVFAALNVPAVTALAPVFQHVPENTQPPFIVVGDIDAEPFGSKDGDLEQQTIEIEYVARGKGRRELLAMMNAGREALEGQPISANGADLSRPRWLNSSALGAEDGVTYAGVQQYEVIAQNE